MLGNAQDHPGVQAAHDLHIKQPLHALETANLPGAWVMIRSIFCYSRAATSSHAGTSVRGRTVPGAGELGQQPRQPLADLLQHWQGPAEPPAAPAGTHSNCSALQNVCAGMHVHVVAHRVD